MKKTWVKILTLLLLVSLVLSACGGGNNNSSGGNASSTSSGGNQQSSSDTGNSSGASSSEDETILVGGAIMNLGWPWFLGTITGMEQYVADSGRNIKLQFEDGKFDINTQITQLENMATLGAKGIVIFPVDGKAIIPTMVRLHEENGIKFVVGDYPQTPDSEEDIVWETFVGHDFREMGRVAGEIAVDYLDTLGIDDPVLVYLVVPSAGQASVDRFEGFSEVVLASYPNAHIIQQADAKGDRNSAQSLFENIMQRYDTIHVVSGHNDALALGAYNAAVSANRADEIKFIGIAGDKEVLTYIDEGNPSWLGEVLQDPVVLGYTALEALMKAMDGEELDDTYPLPKPEAITPENIGQYDWKNWSWLGN